jgi:myo-inositol catabolism protein IolC
MDISKETNVEKLKALAYDQLAQLEAVQANLRALNERIAQLSKEAEKPSK